MKVGDSFKKAYSSFLIIEKDFQQIIDHMMKNPELLKLLYYREKDCLNKPTLTSEQKLSLINKQIKIVPLLEITKDCPINVIISFDDFSPNLNNPQFRDCNINFDIVCHPDHWNLGNFQLRPYKIAGEIDSMFNNSKLVGIGTLQFMGASNFILNDQHLGVTLVYQSIQSTEDTIPIKQ